MTELDILNLQSGSITSTGVYFVALSFSIWVAMRVSSVVSQRAADNVVMKAIASVYGVLVVYYFKMTLSFYAYNMELTGHRLATLKASGGDVSAASMDFIANVGASTTPPNFSLMPTDPMVYPLIIALLAIILLPLWGPQDDA